MPVTRLKAIQHAYAEELRIAGPIRNNPKVVEAFATVRRDKFLPPGPWTLHGTVSWRTPDAEPSQVHHNVLISLDKAKGINNGSPSMWAYLFDQLDIKPGERVLQVGAGTGYYTAVLAELVGKQGRVIGIEYDRRLANIALENLKKLSQVRILHGDAAQIDPGHDVDVIVAFTGGTFAPVVWLDRLSAGGRLLIPLVGDNQWGFMLKAVRRGPQFKATALTRVGFYLAKGFRKKSEAVALKKCIDRLKGKLPNLKGLHRGPAPKASKALFYACRTFWLSRTV
jgi:protein-L-isoaspartate(D-aspartate) O-methyltransferase